MSNAFRKAGVFLVSLEDMYVLVDQQKGVMHAVNAAGAAAWARLGAAEADPAFVSRLRELELTAEADSGSVVDPMPPTCEGKPEVLRSNMLLQVAASRPMHRGGWF